MSVLNEIGKRILFFDGGMGSLLQEKGLKPGELPETWNIRHPEAITQIHRSYLEAGSDIILANTFGANRLKYNKNQEYSLETIVAAAMENAKRLWKKRKSLQENEG